jgi:cation/acetate symporter
MDLKTTTFIVVGLSFAVYLYIAARTRAKSTKEFYVAGGGVHPILNGMATGADWMSAASFISMAGIISFSGFGASAYLMGWTGGYVLLAMLLAPTCANTASSRCRSSSATATTPRRRAAWPSSA